MSQWIDVRERLPDHHNPVIVWNAECPADPVSTGRLWDEGWTQAEDIDGFFVPIAVTHWQPMPPPPTDRDGYHKIRKDIERFAECKRLARQHSHGDGWFIEDIYGPTFEAAIDASIAARQELSET